MKKYTLAASVALLLLTSCQTNDLSDAILNQRFVHKYGFDVTPTEWSERAEDGKVISALANGVTIAQSYENGELHGPTTYSFPKSSTVEKLLVYDQGTLLKETLFDSKGMPMKEELFEFDDRRVVTLWDLKGVPLSIEEYDGELLTDGKYFTLEHELETKVEEGYGERVQRDREGLLLSRDQIEHGILAQRITYHPNGQIQTVSHYHDYQLHGPQLKFSSLGRPLMELSWNHGVLDGTKVVYRNGIKVSEIPYINGERHGLEFHYDDLGHLIAEIPWRNDKKHGCCRTYAEESNETSWFFDGRAVSAIRFDILEAREQLVAEFYGLEPLDVEDVPQ